MNGINLVEDGYVAVIDKPLEWTSADVVRKVKFRLQKMGYRKIKVGHAGTLTRLQQVCSLSALVARQSV